MSLRLIKAENFIFLNRMLVRRTMLRKYIIPIFMLVFSLAFINARAHHPEEKTVAGKASFTKHFNGSLFMITEKAEFSIEILLDEKEYKIGKDVIGIVVHDRNDSDVENADIKINYKDMKETPVIKEKGDGLYIVSNLDIKKKGKWNLNIAVKKKKIEDTAAFIFPDALNKFLPAGKYDSDAVKNK